MELGMEYVGHPLVQVIEESVFSTVLTTRTHNSPLIALLPGSRNRRLLEASDYAEVCKHFTSYQFVVAQAPSVKMNFYF